MWEIFLLNDASVLLYKLTHYEKSWVFGDIPYNSVIQHYDRHPRFDGVLNSYRIED